MKMNKAKKIIAGAAMVSQLLFASYAGAQEKKSIFAPTKIATETSISASKDCSGIPFQRAEIGNDYWTFKYDFNMKLKPSDCPANVGMFSLNKIYSKNNTIIGAEVLQVGKFDGKDTWFADAWLAGKKGKFSYMLDLGKGFPSEGKNRDYVISNLRHPKFSAMLAYYAMGGTFQKGVEIRKYAYLSYHDHNICAAAGNNVNTGFALAAIIGKEDFGHLSFITHNRKTGDIWFKSQTGLQNADQNFYSVSTMDLACDILGTPMFQPIHLGPASTKGEYAVKFEYKKHAASAAHEYEALVATKKLPLVQVGVGINSEYSSECKTKRGAVIEIYKPIKAGKFSASFEGRYNSRNSTATAYIKMSRTF